MNPLQWDLYFHFFNFAYVEILLPKKRSLLIVLVGDEKRNTSLFYWRKISSQGVLK